MRFEEREDFALVSAYANNPNPDRNHQGKRRKELPKEEAKPHAGRKEERKETIKLSIVMFHGVPGTAPIYVANLSSSLGVRRAGVPTNLIWA